jgi:hypothetical protein
MLVIRDAQMAALLRPRVEPFLERLVAALRAELPAQSAACDVEEVVLYGMTQAEAYGVQTEAAVARYARLQIMFGRDFDREMPWARQVLSDPATGEDVERMNHLTRAAIQYAAKLEGASL